MRLGVVTDLAVGTAPGGYDHWLRQGMVADRLSVGAPPDPLGPAGQDWGLPPLLPDALTADGYAGFAADLAANMAHAGGIRIDHVMGLFRLFVLPVGAPASAGTYITYPADDLLSVVALESRRARCVVIGEDLGTVEAGVRETLGDHGILAYRLAWFEHGPPEHMPRLAMAAVTTHDLPTVAGAYSGASGDLDLERLAPIVGDRDPAVALYAHVGSSPALLACAALDDVLGATVQPNVPGTVDEFPTGVSRCRRRWSRFRPTRTHRRCWTPSARAGKSRATRVERPPDGCPRRRVPGVARRRAGCLAPHGGGLPARPEELEAFLDRAPDWTPTRSRATSWCRTPTRSPTAASRRPRCGAAWPRRAPSCATAPARAPARSASATCRCRASAAACRGR